MVGYKGSVLLLPPGKTIAQVDVVPGNKRSIGYCPVQPAPLPVPISKGGQQSETLVRDEKIYLSSSLFPGRLMGQPQVQWKSGLPLLFVNLTSLARLLQPTSSP